MTFPRLLATVFILWMQSSDMQTSAGVQTSTEIQTSPENQTSPRIQVYPGTQTLASIQTSPGMQTFPEMQTYSASYPHRNPPTVCCRLHSHDRAVNKNNNNNSNNNNTSHLLVSPQLQPHPSTGRYSKSAADDTSADGQKQRETTASFDAKSPSWLHISATISDGKVQCGKDLTKNTQCDRVNPIIMFQGEVWSLAVSPQQFIDLFWYMKNVVLPLISVVGITGCVISLRVLTKSGLGKPPNILLFLLSIADILALQKYISYTHHLQSLVNSRKLPHNVALLLYALYVVCGFLNGVGIKAATFIVLWVTGERLVAIFFPLDFKTVVTTGRVWALGFITFVILSVWGLYLSIPSLITEYGLYPNKTFSEIVITWSQELGKVNTYVSQTLTYTVPLVLVLLGCVVIAIKLSFAQHRRRLLSLHSGTNKSRNRTTKTLLLVSLCFLMTRCLILYDYAEPVFRDGIASLIMAIVGQFKVLAMALGTAADCAVFIFYNGKFRTIFYQMFKLHPRLRHMPRFR